MHGQRKIPMDQINLSGTYVIVHKLPVGGQEKRLAGRALEVAEHLHHYRGVLRAECFVRIDVGYTAFGLSSSRLRSRAMSATRILRCSGTSHFAI
jgi:hypothetical protein